MSTLVCIDAPCTSPADPGRNGMCSLHYRREYRRRKPEQYAAEKKASAAAQRGNPDVLRRKRERRLKLTPEQRSFEDKQSCLRRLYGISVEQMDAMWKKQGGLCAICDIQMQPDARKPRSVVIDHCHETGQVRGLLCRGCNSGLGNFYDSPDALQRAAQYLRDGGHQSAILEDGSRPNNRRFSARDKSPDQEGA